MPYYTVQGRKLYYEIKGSGIPLILLHGYLGDSKTHFGKQLHSELTEKYQIIAPDYRGFGNSQLEEFKRWGEKHTSEQLLEDLKLLVDFLHLDKFFIGGYSVGAALALEYGKAYGPNKVKGIILISPRPFTHAHGKSYPYLSKKSRSSSNFLKRFISNSTWGILKRYYKRKSRKDIERKLEDKDLINSFKLLKNIPVFMVYANKDSVTPKVAFEVLEEQIPHIEVEIFDGDHGVLHEQAEKFNRVLESFLDKYA